MFKRTRVFLILIFIISSVSVYSQTWPISKQIECNTDLRVLDIKTDQNDDIFITGVFKGTMYDSTSQGNFDIFLMKLDQNYDILWYKTYGGSKKDHNPRFTIDQANNIFLTGYYQDSCIFEDTYLKSQGLQDIFLLKITSNGTMNWVKSLATAPSKQIPSAIDVDKNNDLIIVGSFIDSVEINSTKYVSAGTNQFILKTDTSNTSTTWIDIYPCSNALTKITSVSAFDDGYFFSGFFYDDIDINGTLVESAFPGKADLLIYGLDYDGNNPWIRRSYGDGNDATGSITQDNRGNVYFTGYFNSTSMTIDSTSTLLSNIALTNKGDFDIFILKYTVAGRLLWAKGYGLEGRDYGININQNNDILYVGGYFSDSIVFNEDTLKTTGLDDKDLFLSTFDLEGNIYNAAKIGGNLDDYALSMHVTNDSKAILSGFFESTTLTVGDSTYTNSGTLHNGIVAKYYAPLSAAFTKVKNPTCNSYSNGELIVTPIFGEKPYTYSWSHDGGLSDSTATSLSAGTYTVTITDALDSTDVTQLTLTEPNPFIFNPTITNNTNCSYSEDGVIDLNPTGGNGGNIYIWTGPDPDLVGGAEDQTSLIVGEYNITITDDESCTADTSIIITGPEAVSFAGTIITGYTGFDPTNTGAVDLELTGGTGTPSAYGASWTGPSAYTATTQDIIGLNPGNYTVTITDANSCNFDTTVTVLDEDNFFAYISASKNACKGSTNGYAVVSFYSPDGNTDISYQWDSNAGNQIADTAFNLAPGLYYHVTVTDNTASESYEDSVYIDELSYDFSGSLSGTDSVDCKGDTDGYIDLIIVDDGVTPYAYSWSNGETTQDIFNLGIGVYNVTVTDDNLCSFIISNYEIEEPALDLTVIASIEQEPLCNAALNGQVRADATGGNDSYVYSYQWDDPAYQITQIATGLDANTYEVVVTDEKGCTASDIINLTQPEALESTKSIENLSCNGAGDGSATLTVVGGTSPYTYLWSTENGSGLAVTEKDQTGLSAGKYYFTITDSHDCLYEDSIEITEPAEIVITSETATDATNNSSMDGSVVVEASGGTTPLTFTLKPGDVSNGTGVFDNLNPGTYTVEVSDVNDCGPITSSSLTVGAINSISGLLSGDNLLIYPNPTNGVLNIKIESAANVDYNLQIISISGQIVYNKKFNASNKELQTVSLSEFSKGLYFVKIFNNKGSYQEKIILQ